ncbi:MAG: NAD-dependent epimerase/dehydratase family protein [Anaerolineae bacterium]|nr:NAD-dependent epimerase/dehydratase family protein [Anaerolineae bacterium]
MADHFLVTGAQGFIGALIVKDLLEAGIPVTVFDLDTTPRRLRLVATDDQIARATFVHGDVTDLPSVEATVVAHSITRIIHLAGLQIPACRADPLLGARVNVLGTLALFEAARRHADQVQRIVYASSIAVIGPEEAYTGPVTDDARLLPKTHYGVFKQANEGNALVYWLENKVSSIGLRPYTVYGAGRDAGFTSAPTKAIKAAVAGRPYTIGYVGPNDMLYVDDCARAFIGCAQVPFQGAEVFNISGVMVTIEEFIAELERVIPEAKGLVRCQGKPIAISPHLDDSRLRRLVPDLPRTPLRQGIAETVAIFRRLQREGRLDLSDLSG